MITCKSFGGFVDRSNMKWLELDGESKRKKIMLTKFVFELNFLFLI